MVPVGGCMLTSCYYSASCILYSLLKQNDQLLQLVFSSFAAYYSIKDKLDLHIESGFIFWTDNASSTSYRGIYKAKTDGGGYSSVINSGVGRRGIQGLAIDWIAGMKPLIHPTIPLFIHCLYNGALGANNE